MSRISIVVPMYNEARHIARTLLSARTAAETAGLDCELIVADNGSSDDGPQIARALGASVLSLPGLTIGALRNRAAAASTGNWLAFLDADIEVPDNWLCLLLDLYREGRGDVFALDCETPPQAPWFASAWQRRSLRAGQPLRRTQWLPTPNLLMQRHWFDRVGGFNETLRTGEDKDFTLRLSLAGARQLARHTPAALNWGFEVSWGEWLGKELWRQGSHLQLLRNHGPSLRLLRFPLMSTVLCLLEALVVVATLCGSPLLALLLLMVTSLPALALSLRQSLPHRDLLLALQLWGLHWIRMHLTGAAFVLSLFNWNARRPDRG